MLVSEILKNRFYGLTGLESDGLAVLILNRPSLVRNSVNQSPLFFLIRRPGTIVRLRKCLDNCTGCVQTLTSTLKLTCIE